MLQIQTDINGISSVLKWLWPNRYGYNRNNDLSLDKFESITIYIHFIYENNKITELTKKLIQRNIAELKKVVSNVNIFYNETTQKGKY